MKSSLKAILFLLFLFNSHFIYSQITITELEKTETKIVLKPEVYDSLKNWDLITNFEIGKYKKYVGLEIFLPPKTYNKIGVDYQQYNFLFSTRPSKIKWNSESNKLGFSTSNPSLYKMPQLFDSIITYVYKPIHYYSAYNRSGGDKYDKLSEWYDPVKIFSDSSKVSNKYFTIIDVIFGEKLDSIMRSMSNRNNLAFNRDHKIFQNELRKEIGIRVGFGFPDWIFLLKDKTTGDSLYCFYPSYFILVPYFVKQQKLFQKKYLIYDDNTKNEFFDSRFIVKYIDDNGKEISTGKKVSVDPGSKWFCKEVTLIKEGYYEIRYILKNDKDEQIVLPDLRYFIEEQEYNKRESDKKMQAQQLIAKRKQEEQIWRENERKAIEKNRADCINKFGLQDGELIAQGKVRIGMSLEMCKSAWGIPYWTSKTTTENGIYENWYYYLGYRLHFANGILKRIDE